MVLIPFSDKCLNKFTIDKKHCIIVDHNIQDEGPFLGKDSFVYDDALMVHLQGITFKEIQALQLNGIRKIGH